MRDNSQIFELFFIRYVNYLNIWSVQLSTDNLYSEISDGLLLGVLLKHWSRLYGYNANGNLNLFKRPLSNNQALANIEICINYIINPPENSYLPQYNSSNELDITPNDIYFKNKLKILEFCNDIFHLYMAPYLRLKSQKILSWFNKYINLHGLSLSEETINGFYQLIPINDELNNNISNLMSERLSSWKLLVEFEHNVKDNIEDLNKLEYYNPLQCDITSDGCILLMILLYHMGWIDVSLLCQMVYIPQSRQHFLWNHETIYYTLQEIKKHLELRNGILLDIISDHVNTSYMNNYDLPFLLLPLSCLSMVKFSPYIIMLQLDIFYNILTEIVEEDVEDHNSNNLPLYGPYHPIDLQFLDDFTFKDGFPLSWNLISYKNETENPKFVKSKDNNEDSSEINSNNSKDIIDNSDSGHWDSEYDDYNNEMIYNNSSKIQNVETEQDYQIDDMYSDNTGYTDEDSNEMLYDKSDNYIDFRDKVNCPKTKPFIKKNIESISRQDYQNNDSTENIHLSKISHDNDSVSVNDMISGLEVELKLLRGYEEDIKLEYPQENQRYFNNEIKDDISNNMDISNNSINDNQIKVEDNYLSRKLSNKSLLSRSGIETNKQEILDNNKDVDTFGIFNITRKSSDAVSKITTAMKENDRLLEKLRQSLNKTSNNQSGNNTQKKVTLIPCKLEIVENIPETNSNTPLNENYNPNESISIEVPKIDNVNIEQININTSQKKNKKASRVSFSDLVMIEVERSKSLK
ncbi:hypothetical protein cand_033700 [Cryptosporidium andersoni]|uniref:Uncharacterized protein n=1 Tax=Cryptosporidium andersoni TaxID=117008 RepID=A0A1J4MVT1_9CRYT|nr:hypothetical protein cand_033700 [Cryptosporidium andersoni]